MSHHTGIGNTGTPSGSNFASGVNTQNDIWVDVADPPAGGMYVDGLHFYGGGGDQGILGGHSNSINSRLWLGHWNGSGHTIDMDSGVFSVSNGAQWMNRTLTPTFLNQPTLSLGWYSDPSTFRCWIASAGGTWHWDSQTGTWPISPGAGTSGSGTLGGYYDYWDPCSISALTATPVAPGQNFIITGTSFSATISSIDVNGTAVTSYTVNSDGQITATVPVGATTGPVHVVTNVGTATSGSNLTVSSMYVNTGTPASPIWTPAAGIYINTGTPAAPVWTAATQVAVNTGTSGSPIWTPGG